jgi:hypothetical protein
MRAKTLLLAAVLSAATLATVVAQTPVFSVNAVGYVNVTVPAGKFAILANPLNQPTNSLAAVLPDVPVNTVVYKYSATAGFSTFTKRATGWTGTGAAEARLNPGEGFFIRNAGATDMTITFVGEVPQGTDLSIDFGQAGFYLISSIVPQAGKVETDLKLTAAVNDRIFKYDPATGYLPTVTKRATGWTPGGEPSVNVAEGFFYQASAPGKWTRSFSVNQ